MKILMLILASIALFFASGCVSKSSYVDKLARQVFKNSVEIHRYHPTTTTLQNRIDSRNLAETSSSITSGLFGKLVSLGANFMSGGSFGGIFQLLFGGAAGTTLITSVLAIFQKKKLTKVEGEHKKLKKSSRKAASEKDKTKAHAILDDDE